MVRLARVVSSGGVTLHRLRVKNFSDFPDSLLCVTWDGETEGADEFHVAKPFGLRRTPFHGQTVDGITYTFSGMIRRTASKSGIPSETQVIIPGYFVDGELYAASGLAGASGVDVAGVGVTDFMDVNIDARAWAAESSDAAAAALAAATPVTKHNFEASTDPTVDDDSDSGYGRGSRWVNATADTHFVLVDPSPGAAIWLNTSEVLALADLSDVTGKTGTGSVVVMQTSPTIVTPTLSSWTWAGVCSL